MTGGGVTGGGVTGGGVTGGGVIGGGVTGGGVTNRRGDHRRGHKGVAQGPILRIAPTDAALKQPVFKRTCRHRAAEEGESVGFSHAAVDRLNHRNAVGDREFPRARRVADVKAR